MQVANGNFGAYSLPAKISILLEDSAKQTVVDGRGRSLLHTAAMNGSVEITGLLLKYGVNGNAYSKSKRTPLHAADPAVVGIA